MTLEILALILAPSILVFLIGCAVALVRTFSPSPRPVRRAKTRARAT